MSNDSAIASGQQTGLDLGKTMYGQNIFQTGNDVQDIIKRRKAAMNQTDPASDQIRQGANAQVRNLRANGVNNPAQINAIQRQARSDIGNQLYSQQNQSTSDFQKLMGNVLSGQNSMVYSNAALEKSGQPVPQSSLSSGFMNTIICSELCRQGYMSEEIRMADMEHGKKILEESPEIYFGYIFLARPVVSLMKKSSIFTRIIALPTLCWAYHIAGKRNLTGLIINTLGSALCAIVGRITHEVRIEKRV
jgi:hypothetical protein